MAPPARIEVVPRLYYNPGLKSAPYIVPGIAAMLLVVVTTLVTAMGLAREREQGTLEQVAVTPVPASVLLAAKMTPFVFIGFFDVLLLVTVGTWVFGVPLRGNLSVMALATLLYLLSTLGVGLLISTISANQQQAFLGGFLFTLPAMLLSGIMTPVDSMPRWMQWLTYANPLRYFQEIARANMMKGARVRRPLAAARGAGALRHGHLRAGRGPVPQADRVGRRSGAQRRGGWRQTLATGSQRAGSAGRVAGPALQRAGQLLEVHPARVLVVGVADHGVPDLVDEHRRLDAGDGLARVEGGEPDVAVVAAERGADARALDVRRALEDDRGAGEVRPVAAPVGERGAQRALDPGREVDAAGEGGVRPDHHRGVLHDEVRLRRLGAAAGDRQQRECHPGLAERLRHRTRRASLEATIRRRGGV